MLKTTSVNSFFCYLNYTSISKSGTNKKMRYLAAIARKRVRKNVTFTIINHCFYKIVDLRPYLFMTGCRKADELSHDFEKNAFVNV